VTINCLTKREGAAIKLALEDKGVRALVVVMGYLLELSSDRVRGRVLRWVIDKLDEEER